jgi:transmembrane sensor
MGKKMNSELKYDLAIKYLNGSASDLEKAEFDGWLNSSEENRFQYDDFRKYWELSGNAFANYQPDTEIAWKYVSKNTIYQKESPFKTVYRIAVAIAVILAIGLGIKLYKNSTNNINNHLVATISNDTIKEIKLEDGSVIWLNANSKLDVPVHFTKKERKVTLNGEAYFEIARDERRPFRIESKNTITEVLGTAFNIRANENETDVTVSVSNGKVAFYSSLDKSEKLVLTPGMKGVWKEDSNKLTSITEENQNYLAWKTKILKFKNTPLTEVCNTISKNYNIRIKVDAGQAKNYLFTGNFENVKVDQMLDIIASTLDIKFINSNGQFNVKFK